MLKMKLLGGALAVAFAAPALAQSQSYGMSEFRSLDTDGNGSISQSEWERAHQRQRGSQAGGLRMPSTGATSSGQWAVLTITPVESRAIDEQRRESTFRALDTNGDGSLSAAEAGVNTVLVQAFSRLDANGDGRIDRVEFNEVHVQEPGQSASGASSGGQPQ